MCESAKVPGERCPERSGLDQPGVEASGPIRAEMRGINCLSSLKQIVWLVAVFSAEKAAGECL